MDWKINRRKNEQNINTLEHYRGIRFIFHNIKQYFKNRKYIRQRIKWGFSYPDTWDMSLYLSDVISAMLEHMADRCDGYPDKQTDPENGFDTYEEWIDALRECAYKLYYSSEEHNSDEMRNPYEEQNRELYKKWTTKDNGDGSSTLVTNYTPEDEEIQKKYFEEEAKIWSLKEQYKNEALDFLKKHWYALWW